MNISLKAARVNAGMTQDEVAKQLNRNVMTISNWETGKTSPSWKDLVQLSELYRVETNLLRSED